LGGQSVLDLDRPFASGLSFLGETFGAGVSRTEVQKSYTNFTLTALTAGTPGFYVVVGSFDPADELEQPVGAIFFDPNGSTWTASPIESTAQPRPETRFGFLNATEDGERYDLWAGDKLLAHDVAIGNLQGPVRVPANLITSFDVFPTVPLVPGEPAVRPDETLRIATTGQTAYGESDDVVFILRGFLKPQSKADPLVDLHAMIRSNVNGFPTSPQVLIGTAVTDLPTVYLNTLFGSAYFNYTKFDYASGSTQVPAQPNRYELTISNQPNDIGLAQFNVAIENPVSMFVLQGSAASEIFTWRIDVSEDGQWTSRKIAKLSNNGFARYWFVNAITDANAIDLFTGEGALIQRNVTFGNTTYLPMYYPTGVQTIRAYFANTDILVADLKFNTVGANGQNIAVLNGLYNGGQSAIAIGSVDLQKEGTVIAAGKSPLAMFHAGYAAPDKLSLIDGGNLVVPLNGLTLGKSLFGILETSGSKGFQLGEINSTEPLRNISPFGLGESIRQIVIIAGSWTDEDGYPPLQAIRIVAPDSPQWLVAESLTINPP